MCVFCKNIYHDKNNFSSLKEKETELTSGVIDNTSNPLVSIIITVYKRKRYIHEAINSAMYQINIDFDYEIIVLCDDPKDDMAEFDIYKSTHDVFIYRNCSNFGLYNSINLGAQIARGCYIVFLHDDDILYPEYLSEISNFLLEKKHEPKCVLVNRDVAGLSSQRHIKKITKFILYALFLPFFIFRFLFRKSYKTITLKEGLMYVLSNIYKAPSCGTLFEKDAFLKSGGFNQDFWPVSDYYFFLKFNRDFSVYMLRKKLACYRWFDNLSQNKSVQHMGFEHLSEFFKSIQPIKSINKYYSFFYNEVLYAKFIMINKEYRNEIIDTYQEIKQHKKIKWFVFKLYNKAFGFFHDIIV